MNNFEQDYIFSEFETCLFLSVGPEIKYANWTVDNTVIGINLNKNATYGIIKIDLKITIR